MDLVFKNLRCSLVLSYGGKGDLEDTLIVYKVQTVNEQDQGGCNADGPIRKEK